MITRRAPTESKRTRDLLQPMRATGLGAYLLAAILLVVIGWFLYAWYLQLTQGLGVTGLRTPVGAAWGGYIANFVFFVGIAHGGIAVAAAIRLLKLTTFTPVARIGEVLTVISIMMAGISIMIDMGRPDRTFNMVIHWAERVGTSSLTWDMTVIVVYFALSLAYLWLTMREDLAKVAGRFPRLSWLYRPLLIGYRTEEKLKVDRMTWWLSLAIVFLIVMLSGGVVPWIFGLLPARPGWFSAMAGPYFLTASIASAIACVILVAAILRRVFRWQDYIGRKIFSGLGTFLGVICLFYLYLVLSEQLTMRYAAPAHEVMVSDKLLLGEFAPIFWPMVGFGFFLFPILLIVQAIWPRWFSVTRTVMAASVILIAFWVKRFLIVVPSQLRPLLPFPDGSYSPSWVEWSMIAGTFAIAILLYAVFLKLFPIVDLEEE